MNHLMFSDESGGWSNHECDVYVRSFIVINEVDYHKKVRLKNNKYPDLLKIKWHKSGEIRKNDELCGLLFSNIQVFIEFTDLPQFRAKNYKVKEEIKNLKVDNYLQGFKNQFKLEEALLNKCDQLYFLNIYEREFMERFYKSAKININNLNLVRVYFDNPQQNDRDFKPIVQNTLELVDKFPITIIKDDKDELGIGIADLIAGCWGDILVENEERSAIEFYRKYIKPCTIPNSYTYPNPDYQFRTDGQEKYKTIQEGMRKS